jgi:hypothetical protein
LFRLDAARLSTHVRSLVDLRVVAAATPTATSPGGRYCFLGFSWKLMLAPWFSVAHILTTTEARPWDYLINLSGDAFPVLTPGPLRRTLHNNGRHLNYVTCSTSVRGRSSD